MLVPILISLFNALGSEMGMQIAGGAHESECLFKIKILK